MVQKELQTFQQRRRGIWKTHGQSAESMYANAPETNNEMMTYAKGQQRAQVGQIQIMKRSSNALANLGLPVSNIGLGNALNSNWKQLTHTTVDLVGQTSWPEGDNQGSSYNAGLNIQPINGCSIQPEDRHSQRMCNRQITCLSR